VHVETGEVKIETAPNYFDISLFSFLASLCCLWSIVTKILIWNLCAEVKD